MTEHQAMAATPHAELLAQLMNPNNLKNEREHAAVREIERLREALAQPEQRPVAWMYTSKWKGNERFITHFQTDLSTYKADEVWPLFTSPPQRQLESTTDMMMELADRLGELPDDIDPRAWEHLLVYASKRQPMTDEDLDLMCEKALFCRISFQQFARSIEAAHDIGDKT